MERQSNSAYITSGLALAVGNSWDTWSGGVSRPVPRRARLPTGFTFFWPGRGSTERGKCPKVPESGLQINMRAGYRPHGSGLSGRAIDESGAVGARSYSHWPGRQLPATVEATATFGKSDHRDSTCRRLKVLPASTRRAHPGTHLV